MKVFAVLATRPEHIRLSPRITERSRQNLLRDGIAGERICVTDNPIFEMINRFERQIVLGLNR